MSCATAVKCLSPANVHDARYADAERPLQAVQAAFARVISVFLIGILVFSLGCSDSSESVSFRPRKNSVRP